MPSGARTIGVVGASGFLGRALVARLAGRSDVSLRLFGRDAGQVADLPIQPLDLNGPDFRGLDVMIHLSGITSSRVPEPELRRVNVDFAVAVARAAAAVGVGRFVFASSLHAQAKSSDTPIAPGSPYRPADSYGRSKGEAEQALAQVAGQTGLELAIVRPPMIYGPGGRGSFQQLVALVRTGLPLPLALAGYPRSFCSVANAASAVEYTALSPQVRGPLLPADPEDISPRDLVGAIAVALDRPARLWPVPRALMAAPLALIGRSAIVTSLFEPLCIDRDHWEATGWRPIETGAQGLTSALAEPR